MPDVAVLCPTLTHPATKYEIEVPRGRKVVPMGTIIERRRKDGSPSFTAQIVVKRKGAPTYREAKTFDRRSAAVAFIKRREPELRQAGGAQAAAVERATVGDAIDLYVKQSLKEIGRTKAQVLEAIKGDDIAAIRARDVTSADIVAYGRRLSEGRKPQTVGNYMSHLSAVFAIAKPAWGIPLDAEQMKSAAKVLSRLGLTSKSDRRDRRPTMDEVNALMTFFSERNDRSPDAAPMDRIIGFALFSTRRLSEILRIEWRDVEPDRVLVRDMKHPGQKIGNDVWCDLPAEAVLFMGEPGKGRVFPYGDDAVGASFTRACKVLEIDDLHFHDLRHEGVSRLFEMGKSIPHVAAVSGHRSWASLQRYTHLRAAGDKWAGWQWLPGERK